MTAESVERAGPTGDGFPETFGQLVQLSLDINKRSHLISGSFVRVLAFSVSLR